MKIVVVGLGYVGLSNAALLSQKHEVIGVDISSVVVGQINNRKPPIKDKCLERFFAEKDLMLSASLDLKSSIRGADYVIVATPTNYDELVNSFDTESVRAVIADVTKHAPNASIVIKSTIPIGFVDEIKAQMGTSNVMFSPEFLREGTALYDNLYPSRIIVGDKSERAETFANLLANCSFKEDVNVFLTGAKEAEAIKLFSNSYLAMRVAFFNELDTYALANDMLSGEIISGMGFDPRIGSGYNNPSFGYGGYCLPKDTKQLLSNFADIPQDIIEAIVNANDTRKNFIADTIIARKPKLVGIYRLQMKMGSDNFRNSAIQGIINRLNTAKIETIIYEPSISEKTIFGLPVVESLNDFKRQSDLIVCNRTTPEIMDVYSKVFTRDIFHDS